MAPPNPSIEQQAREELVERPEAVSFADLSPAMVAYFGEQPVTVRSTGPYGNNKAIETVWWSDASYRHASYTRDPAEAKVWPLREIYGFVRSMAAETQGKALFERQAALASPATGGNELGVAQADNAATVKLTEWLILNDFFDEDGAPEHQRLVEQFGFVADQVFRRHRLASPGRGVEEAYERAAKVADYAVERAERDWHDPVKQEAVKQVAAEIAEVIRAYATDAIPQPEKEPR